MYPWCRHDVKIVLKEKFNFNSSQPFPHLYSLCYLLSGSPEHLTSFHRLLLNDLKSEKTTISQSIRNCLSTIISNKEDSSRKRLDRIFSNEETREEIKETIFNLLFGEKYIVPQDSLLNNIVGKAFIETAFAHVVQVGKKELHFDIVDPISFSVYYQTMFKNYRGQLWNHLRKNIKKQQKGIVFEYFMHLLILEESEKYGSIRDCKLFAGLPKKEFENYSLKVNSFVRAPVFSEQSIERNERLSGLWVTQTDGFLLDNLVKPDDNIGPDLVFYLDSQEKEKLLVSTSFSLVSDPKDDNQTNNAIRLFETTDPQRIVNKNGETTIENLEYSPHKIGNSSLNAYKKCIRWLVCPFMKPVGVKWLQSNGHEELANPFQSNLHHLLWTTRNELDNCIEGWFDKGYHSDMVYIWDYFKSNHATNE
ncbi:predicted protein [Naegleria gruberi]|uniref:Predicted protein n=1 Tax=Naegleria gruberi TaxID=5762 RepID=D2VWR5_NAEGR|nr:uncharacterized protein NAEGRDRAFT_73476 [Naegleria gruberi]EFC38667.1 predicted protein [Naegleria gruberi]|eukprot:XP_002671411.1 predicted protein [Naegleria gruberi strain NEG-M]